MALSFSKNVRGLMAAVCCGALILMFWPSLGKALENGRYTESEKVGFAFHKLAGFDPHYEQWIKDMEKYVDAHPADKLELLQKERYRLESGFLGYIPDVDLVSLDIQAVVKSSNYFAQSQKEGVQTDVTIELVELPENYFPFYIGGMWIALVIKDFDTLLRQRTFTAEEYQTLAKLLGLTGAYQLTQKVNIDLHLRPLSVDTSSPLTLDGLEMWLMLVEIGEMTVWRKINNNKQVLWTYTAPWYISDSQKELLMLYEK